MSIQIRNEQEFEALFREMYVPLCRKAYKVLKDKETSEDLVQEVFVKIWEKRNELHIATAIQPYLYRAVMNAAFNEIRKSHPFIELEAGKHEAAEQSDSSDMLIYKDTAQKIDSAIDELPPACRTIFILSREDGLSYKEIAESLSISVKTVENQMGKALKILREKISTYLVLIVSVLINF